MYGSGWKNSTHTHSEHPAPTAHPPPSHAPTPDLPNNQAQTGGCCRQTARTTRLITPTVLVSDFNMSAVLQKWALRQVCTVTLPCCAAGRSQSSKICHNVPRSAAETSYAQHGNGCQEMCQDLKRGSRVHREVQELLHLDA